MSFRHVGSIHTVSLTSRKGINIQQVPRIPSVEELQAHVDKHYLNYRYVEVTYPAE